MLSTASLFFQKKAHQFENVIKKDKARQNKLEKAGFRVLRFQDNDVLKEITRVRQIIWDNIEDIEKNIPPPTPSKGGHIGETNSLSNRNLK